MGNCIDLAHFLFLDQTGRSRAEAALLRDYIESETQNIDYQTAEYRSVESLQTWGLALRATTPHVAQSIL